MAKTHVVINHSTGKVVLTSNYDNCKIHTIWANKLTGQFHKVYPILNTPTPTLSLTDREYTFMSTKPALPDPTLDPIRSKVPRSVIYRQ